MSFSVNQYNDYYLQVWKNSKSSSRTLHNPEHVIVAYESMRIYTDNTIHGGGFKIFNSVGNYRIQLHLYDKYPYHTYIKNAYYKTYIYIYIYI